MKDVTRIDHFKKNKEDNDYIKVYDRNLKKETIKPIKDIIFENKSLQEEINNLKKQINELKSNFVMLESLFSHQNKELREIKRGLNLRWKRS